MSPNYYEVLGLRDVATSKEIRSAWKYAAKHTHSDVNCVNSDNDFISAREAYEVLNDPIMRSEHDRDLTAEKVAGSVKTFDDTFTPSSPSPKSRRSFQFYVGTFFAGWCGVYLVFVLAQSAVLSIEHIF